MRFKRMLVALCLAASMLVASSASAQASPSSDLETLVRLSYGQNADQIRRSAETTAAQLRVSPDSLLASWAKEALSAERRALAKKAKAKSPAGNIQPQLSGSGTIPLGTAWFKGDVFVSTAGFLWYGHAGIFASTSSVIHAPGPNQNSVWVSANSVGVGRGSVQDYVAVASTYRNYAGNFAINYLQNKPYNLNFWDNHYVWSSAYNCSQLVWAAYRGSIGLDLDGNGGSGVYPWDIDASGWTTTYRVY